MIEKAYDTVVIGGGSAGMAAALSVREQGRSVAIVEREELLGGILMQCIHNGFGLHEFGEELTGPEFAERFISRVIPSGIDVYLDTTVMGIGFDGPLRVITAGSKRCGMMRLSSRTVVLAMGCRERNRGNVAIAGHPARGGLHGGTRPAPCQR